MNASNQRGYPLSLLFVLIFLCAILLAELQLVFRWPPAARAVESFGHAILGGILGIVLGLLVGCYLHPGKAIPLGCIVGLFVGCLSGPLVLIPLENTTAVFYVALSGSALMITIGLVVRVASSTEARALRDQNDETPVNPSG